MASSDSPESEQILPLLRAGTAPRELRRFAAEGILPFDANDRMRALTMVLDDPDPAVAREARRTFGESPPEELSRFLMRGAPMSEELDAIARHTEDEFVLEQIVRHRNVADGTLEMLARSAMGGAQEALVGNQVRLLARPELIDALFSNPGLTADARRLLNELKEEFFDKQRRRLEAERSRQQSEALDKLREELKLDADEEAEAGGEGDASAADEASEERDLMTSGELYVRIMRMTVPERIKLALSGGKEERRLLVGDVNHLVGLSVLKSRGLTVTEVESFCTMRHLEKEIFEAIALRREWIRRESIMIALVKNPKVPLSLSLPLVKRLPMREMRRLARDRNLAEALRATARRTYLEKRK